MENYHADQAQQSAGIPEGIPPVLGVEQFVDPATDWRALAAQNVCAVLGNPIAHSLSPLLHNRAYQQAHLDFTYVRVQAGEAREIRQLMSAQDSTVHGFSVTMPGKAAALELADLATERAEAIGSANTLVPQEDGRWLADNTDVDGITACLGYLSEEAGGIQFRDGHAIIVGNGGTARPAVAALAAVGVSSVTVLARSERALNLQGLVEDYGMEFSWERLDSGELENRCEGAVTAISTIPAYGAEAIVPALLRAQSIVDVIYDPYPTPLLSAAAAAGLPHADGLRMLAGQAERQFELFTGQAPEPGLMLETVLRPH